jgi:RNA polymerase subunit RPABC4/transcription elongation factor Spt4
MTSNVFTINLAAQPDLDRIKKWTAHGYNSINDIAVVNDVPLSKCMWRVLFNNNQVTHLFVMFSYWNSMVDSILRFNLGHGVSTGLVDITTGHTEMVPPIAYLPRKQSYSNDLPAIKRCRNCGTKYRSKNNVCPVCHIITESTTPILDAVNERLYRLKADAILVPKGSDPNDRHARRVFRSSDARDNQAFFTDRAERRASAEWLATMLNTMDQQPLNLEAMFSLAKEYAGYYERLPENWDAECNDLKVEFFKANPIGNRDALIHFGRSWAHAYELPYPASDADAICTACQVFYYLDQGICPCMKTQEEESYDHLCYLQELATFGDYADLPDHD